MVKCFVTGDNHFGRKFDRFPDVKDKLIQSRFDSLIDMIRKAESEGCELFVITGDLFDNISTIKVSDVKKVVEILATFSGTVLVLPGNHDYYTGDEKVWRDFNQALSQVEHNVILLNEHRVYEFELASNKVRVYPACCQSKHSKENNLEWIHRAVSSSNINIMDNDASVQEDKENVINIGIAHGAIQGITPDMNQEYFLMSEAELSSIEMDAWFIGHTHIQYPSDLREEAMVKGYKIFNAGTHEQLDIHNNTEGCAFIIAIKKDEENTEISAKKYISGRIRYYDMELDVEPTSESALKDILDDVISSIKNSTIDQQAIQSIVRIKIKGSIKQSEYIDKEKIYKEVLGDLLSYEKIDNELSEEITVEKIRTEYAQTSFAAKFMEALIDEPTELQMAYQLLKRCEED